MLNCKLDKLMRKVKEKAMGSPKLSIELRHKHAHDRSMAVIDMFVAMTSRINDDGSIAPPLTREEEDIAEIIIMEELTSKGWI